MPAALLSGRGGPQLRVRGAQSGGQGAGSVEEESHTGPREAAAWGRSRQKQPGDMERWHLSPKAGVEEKPGLRFAPGDYGRWLLLSPEAESPSPTGHQPRFSALGLTLDCSSNYFRESFQAVGTMPR